MHPSLKIMADEVAHTTEVEASAKVLIDGFEKRLQDGIKDALAKGATEEELAVLQAQADALKVSSNELAAAVVANTPGATTKAARKP